MDRGHLGWASGHKDRARGGLGPVRPPRVGKEEGRGHHGTSVSNRRLSWVGVGVWEGQGHLTELQLKEGPVRKLE